MCKHIPLNYVNTYKIFSIDDICTFSGFAYYTTEKKCGKPQKFWLGNIAKILTLCHTSNVNQC